MITFIHEHWLTILSIAIGLFYIADLIRIERAFRRDMAEQTALRVRLIAEAKEREDAYLDLYRDFERCGAFVWNGVGPKRDCLLRLMYADGSTEWSEFEWQEEDGDDAEDGNGHPARYAQEAGSVYVYQDGSSFTPSEDFVVTHWSEIPEVSP